MDKENIVVKQFQQFVPGEPEHMVAVYNQTQISEDTVDYYIQWRDKLYHNHILIMTKVQYENIFGKLG